MRRARYKNGAARASLYPVQESSEGSWHDLGMNCSCYAVRLLCLCLVYWGVNRKGVMYMQQAAVVHGCVLELEE